MQTKLLIGFGLALILGIIIRYYYGKPNYVNGEISPNFTSQLADGTSFNLHQLKGSYILLDFWGSWCPPCRAENQELVPFYEKWKDKTLDGDKKINFVSVGIEKNEKVWKDAIAKDHLDWKWHVSDFQRFDSPIAKLYGVRQIPTKFLIDPNGVIIGVNQDLDEIDKLFTSKSSK
ncbi:MAG: TlpA family protein disulfide reductase [Saprospiraceae bacterium]|nr:TlpA family protein disulfide reductase [Saprospiraceae bacterium]